MFEKMFTKDGTIIDHRVSETVSQIMIRTKVLFEDKEMYFYAGAEGYNDYPMWSRYNHMTFRTEEEAINYARHLTGYGWHWEIIPDTIETINFSIEVQMKIVEYDRVVKKVTL